MNTRAVMYLVLLAVNYIGLASIVLSATGRASSPTGNVEVFAQGFLLPIVLFRSYCRTQPVPVGG